VAQQQQITTSIFGISLRARPAVLISLVILAIVLATVPAAPAQTVTVLHNFTGGADGAFPYAGLAKDRAGNYYGTASAGGGYHRMGVVFRLSHEGSGWVLTPLYSFRGNPDGATPYSGVILGPDGDLYGMTYEGGQNDAGTVYRLRPSPTACGSFLCPWEETVLYSFCPQRPCLDGGGPAYGNLVFDRAGNLYGTTSAGGAGGQGVVFKLSPSGGQWTESVLYSFPSCDNGCVPFGGPIFDSAGNLYGTTSQGGTQNTGVVYELSPSASGWIEHTLASVNVAPYALTVGGLAMDGQGNLFGTAGDAFPGGVFEVTPLNGGWTFNVLWALRSDSAGPYDTPTLDAAGNVYGTSCGEGNDDGEVFKLTPSGGGWSYSGVHFNGSNGECPVGGVVLDGAGNMFGTTILGGPGTCGLGCGLVWEITP